MGIDGTTCKQYEEPVFEITSLQNVRVALLHGKMQLNLYGSGYIYFINKFIFWLKMHSKNIFKENLATHFYWQEGL